MVCEQVNSGKAGRVAKKQSDLVIIMVFMRRVRMVIMMKMTHH